MEKSQEIQKAGVAVAIPENHTNGKKLLERFHFPTFKHESHGPVVNVNEVADAQLTIGQKVADAVAAGMGSWWFIISQSIILACWIVINTIQLAFRPFDPYPFILLNLALSFQAAFAAPFIMISQNRQSQKDRITAQNDYLTDMKGEEEIRHMMEHLDHQDGLTLQIVQRLAVQSERIDQQEKLILQLLHEIKEGRDLIQIQRHEILSALQAHPDQLPVYSDGSSAPEGDKVDGK